MIRGPQPKPRPPRASTSCSHSTPSLYKLVTDVRARSRLRVAERHRFSGKPTVFPYCSNQKPRGSPKSYYVHHTQQISKAAVLYDAMAIRKQILSLRQGLCTNTAAQADPASDAYRA